MIHDPHALPGELPIPEDDGAARHLLGARLPDLGLPTTDGGTLALTELDAGAAVLFFYPRTGVPGQPPGLGFEGETWESIPGARGCTPQSCAFRDLHGEFGALGVRVVGVSTQEPEFQRAFVQRNHLPFPLLSDSKLSLISALRLPTFRFPVESGGPTTLIRRMAWAVWDGRVVALWYPVFPPQDNARRVLDWFQVQLPWLRGVEEGGVVVRREPGLEARELGPLFRSSGIRRPDGDPERLSRMLAGSNLIVTARANGVLVGVARCSDDGGWCVYVADLAVHGDWQRRGLGKRLIAAVRTIVGPEVAVTLAAAPDAAAYYPHIGFLPIESAWRLPRER